MHSSTVKTFPIQAIQFSQTVQIQTIQFSISIVFVKTVLFQTIQFSIQKQFYFKQFSSIWPIDKTLSGSTTTGQSGHGSDGNERVLCIPQSFSITEGLTIRLFRAICRTFVGEGVFLLCKEAVCEGCKGRKAEREDVFSISTSFPLGFRMVTL